MPGKVHVRAQLSLLVGNASFGFRAGAHIQAGRVPVQVHGEECVPGAKRPSVGQFHAGKGLDTMGLSMQQVGDSDGHEQMHRRRVRLQARGSRFPRNEVLILVEEERRIER